MFKACNKGEPGGGGGGGAIAVSFFLKHIF